MEPAVLEHIDRFARDLAHAVLGAAPALDGHWVDESIVDLIAQEYEGRALTELLQNAHDQLDPGGRIHLELVDSADGPAVLYVANDGAPFRAANFEAILRTAHSSKRPGSSIGYKGRWFQGGSTSEQLAGGVLDVDAWAG